MLLDPQISLLLVVDMQEKLVPAMSDKDELLRNCGILMQAASLAGVPALASEQYPDGLGPTLTQLADKYTELRRLPKIEFSCVKNDELKRTITAAARSQIVVCGIEAHVCVTQTAIDLKRAGYDVFVATDATASRLKSSKDIAMQRLSAAGVTIVTTEMAGFEWIGSAAAPAFKPFSKLIR